MTLNSETILEMIRDDTMLSRHHREIERSLIRLQQQGTYSFHEALARFTALATAAQIKMGFRKKRGRPPLKYRHDQYQAIQAMMQGFLDQHPPPPLEEIFTGLKETGKLPEPEKLPDPRVIHFVKPVFPPGVIRKPLVVLVAEMKGEIEDTGHWMVEKLDEFDLLKDHKPDFTGTGESAFFIGVGKSGDPRSAVHPMPPGYDDPDIACSPLESFWKDHQVAFAGEPAQNPWAPLLYSGRGHLRNLDTQTWDDYCSDHAAEIREETNINGYLASTASGSEGSSASAGDSLEEMWDDWMGSHPLSRRLELMVVAAEQRGDDDLDYKEI